MSIVITGCTGKLGSLIVENLVKLTSPSSITASTRSSTSEKALALSKLGVKIVEASFDNPSTLPVAFQGATKVVITSVDKVGVEAFQSHKRAIDAAKTAGVSKIFYVSHLGSKSKSSFGPMEDHWKTEQYLEESGLEFTSFRNGFYMWNLPMLLGGVTHTGKITGRSDGKVSWVSHPDLAEGIAKSLIEDGRSPLPKYVKLTNTVSVDMTEMATYLTEILGRKVEREVISDQAHEDRLVQSGVPQIYANMLVAGFGSFHDGEFAETNDYLAKILGRDCQTVEQYLKEVYVNGKEPAKGR